MKVANDSDTPPIPSLEDMQHWTWVMGRAQQMMLEHGLQTLDDTPALPTIPGFTDKATSRSSCSARRSEEHTSELQSLMRNSYAVFCLKKKSSDHPNIHHHNT